MVPHGVGEEEEARGAGRDLVGDRRGRRALLRARANRSFGGARGREGGEVTCGATRWARCVAILLWTPHGAGEADIGRRTWPSEGRKRLCQHLLRLNCKSGFLI